MNQVASMGEERFEHVKALLKIQERDAARWRDMCVLYFQSYSNMPIPVPYEKPEHDLSTIWILNKQSMCLIHGTINC